MCCRRSDNYDDALLCCAEAPCAAGLAPALRKTGQSNAHNAIFEMGGELMPGLIKLGTITSDRFDNSMEGYFYERRDAIAM